MSHEFKAGDKVCFIPELVKFIKDHPDRAKDYVPDRHGVPGSVRLNDKGQMDRYITDYPYVTIKWVRGNDFRIEEAEGWNWDIKWIEKYNDILSEAEDL
mgnify:CR=1 FL=1